MRNFFLLVVIAFLYSTAGCATNQPRLQNVTTAEKERILDAATIFPGMNKYAQLPEEDILGLSDDMKEFVDNIVAGIYGEQQQIRALLRSLLSPRQLDLQYDEKATFTARETFMQRRANCLSFTTLIVPMLRYLGIRVAFNEVEVPPVWDLQNDNMLVLYQHVNAVVTRSSGQREVLDINMDEYELHYPQREIDDRTVAALFYNNRGMELLLERDLLQAFRYLRKSVELAPQLPLVWINLGTLFRNQGRLDEAEIAYRIALEQEPHNLVAISMAERNYRDLGEYKLAEQFRQRANNFRLRNPYYLYTLARNAALAGEYDTALENIRAAIRRYGKEHRFFFLQGVIYSALEERTQADASFARALELSSSQQQQDSYRRKMEQLI